VHLPHWETLPPHFKTVLESACAEASVWMQSRFDAENPPALRRLVANGAQLRPFTREIMSACYEAAFGLYHEVAASNPRFRAVFEPWLKFREEEYLWFRVAENSFDNFVYVQSQKKT
jgi:TRAP-type mannitol/chloroaromatic compound transport system substrate-binding protein